MDVFHFAEFGKLKYDTIDTYSGFEWPIALNLEKADSLIMYLLEVMTIMRILYILRLIILQHMSSVKSNKFLHITT